jgi:hypothetical protein
MQRSQRLIATWARLYKLLIGNHKTAAFAGTYLDLVEREARPRCSMERILASHEKADRLTAAEIKEFAAAAREDWKAVRLGQPDLLAHRSRTLQELSAQFPAKRSAATPFEAGEELRPRFTDVRDDFISHHTDSVGVGAVRLAKALTRRGRSSWLAQQEIHRPALWNDDLYSAIENCAEFILLMNSHALESPRVRGECGHAIDHKRRVLAVELEPGMDPGRFDIGCKGMQVCIIQWHQALDTDEQAAQLADLIVKTLEAEREKATQSNHRKNPEPA